MCDNETHKKLSEIQKQLIEIKIWIAKRDETILQHQKAIELLMKKANKFDEFQIKDYLPFKIKIITLVVISGFIIGYLAKVFF